MQPGKAPRLRAREVSPKTPDFQLIIATADAVIQRLGEFADKQHITTAHFTAIGALDHAVIGWSDPTKKSYKVVKLDEEMEVTSLTGNLTRDKDGKAVVHVHTVVALLRNGQVYAGHLLEGNISLTMQLYMEANDPLQAAAN